MNWLEMILCQVALAKGGSEALEMVSGELQTATKDQTSPSIRLLLQHMAASNMIALKNKN